MISKQTKKVKKESMKEFCQGVDELVFKVLLESLDQMNGKKKPDKPLFEDIQADQDSNASKEGNDFSKAEDKIQSGMNSYMSISPMGSMKGFGLNNNKRDQDRNKNNNQKVFFIFIFLSLFNYQFFFLIIF